MHIKPCKQCTALFADTSNNQRKYCYDCTIARHKLSHKKHIDKIHATERPDTMQCTICNKWYRKVASHAYQSHSTTAREYKKMLGLDNKKGLITSIMKVKLQSYTTKYKDTVITQNLLQRGIQTRYKMGKSHNYTRTPSQKERLRKQGIINLKNKIK